MKIAYIAHKINGDIENNIQKVEAIVSDINTNEPEVVPFAPYLVDLRVLDDNNSTERARGFKNNEEYFKRGFIDELRVYSDVSAGIKQEIEWASKAGIKIKFY